MLINKVNPFLKLCIRHYVIIIVLTQNHYKQIGQNVTKKTDNIEYNGVINNIEDISHLSIMYPEKQQTKAIPKVREKILSLNAICKFQAILECGSKAMKERDS